MSRRRQFRVFVTGLVLVCPQALRAAPVQSDRGALRSSEVPGPKRREGNASPPGSAEVGAESEVVPGAEPNLASTAAYDEARALYLSGRFEQCTDAFSALLSPENSRSLSEPRLIERGRLYYAACLMGLGRDVDAQEQMRSAIRANPRILPPNPLIFPGPVVSKFAAVHSALLDEIQASEDAAVKRAQEEARAAQEHAERETLRVRVLEQLAASETLVEKNRRWIAAIPFGVGQFQNGDSLLGWLLLGAEVVLGGATVAATSFELLFHSQASRENVDEEQFNSRVQLVNRIQDYGLVGFAVLAVGGIVESQLNFVPERTVGTRPRELPKSLVEPTSPKDKDQGVRLAPGVALREGGWSAGVTGTF